MKATARTVVDRPIEDVWTYVTTLETMGEWVDGVSDVRRIDEGTLESGFRFASQYTYRGETFDVEYAVTTYNPPDRFDITATDGPFPFDGSIRLTVIDGGTEVANTVDAGSDGLATTVIFTVLGPVVRRLMRRQLATELERLAAAVADDGDSTADFDQGNG